MCTSRSLLEADSEDAWHLPLSLEEGRGPRQAGLLAPDHYRWAPSQGLLASVGLAHGSPVTVTGSRRIHTGFPFQLTSSHLSALFTCRGSWPASPPPKGDRIIDAPYPEKENAARVHRAAVQNFGWIRRR